MGRDLTRILYTGGFTKERGREKGGEYSREK